MYRYGTPKNHIYIAQLPVKSKDYRNDLVRYGTVLYNVHTFRETLMSSVTPLLKFFQAAFMFFCTEKTSVRHYTNPLFMSK